MSGQVSFRPNSAAHIWLRSFHYKKSGLVQGRVTNSLQRQETCVNEFSGPKPFQPFTFMTFVYGAAAHPTRANEFWRRCRAILKEHRVFAGRTGWFIYDLVYPAFVTIAAPFLNHARNRHFPWKNGRFLTALATSCAT
jgi:hypothetical protein